MSEKRPHATILSFICVALVIVCALCSSFSRIGINAAYHNDNRRRPLDIEAEGNPPLTTTIITTPWIDDNAVYMKKSTAADPMQESVNGSHSNDKSKCPNCYNGSHCDESTGKCVCWPHFTGDDCAYIACDDNSHERDANRFCRCKEGWSGLQCQSCKSAAFCEAKYGELYSGMNGTWVCDDSVYNHGSVHEKWYQCQLTDGELTQLVGELYTAFWCYDMNLTQTNGSCQMQVYSKMGYPPGRGEPKWPTGQQTEIFYCVFEGCLQRPSVDPRTRHAINTVECKRTKCDTTGHYPYPTFLQEQLDSMIGQASVECDNVTKLCTLTQEELQFMFETNCTSQLGECVFIGHNETKPEPSPPPTPDAPDQWAGMLVRIAIAGAVVGSVVLVSSVCIWMHCAYSYFLRKKNYNFWKEINEEGKSGSDFSFRNISYRLNVTDFASWKHKTILDNISGHVPRGTMLAIMGASGAGKCWGKGTGILMYDGTLRPVEDLKFGDLLMGDDGTPRRIISEPIHGKGQMYHITPKSQAPGRPFSCNDDHILVLRLTGEPYVMDSVHEGRCKAILQYMQSHIDADGDIIVKEKRQTLDYGPNKLYKKFDEAKAALEIALNDLSQQDNYVNPDTYIWEVRAEAFFEKVGTNVKHRAMMYMPGAISFPTREGYLRRTLQEVLRATPTDDQVRAAAYLLGSWLGDGSSSSPCISVAASEKDQLNALYHAIKQLGCVVTVSDNKGNGTYLTLYIKNMRDNGRNPFLALLHSLNLYKNKHIPEELALDELVNVRYRLLAGLLDTDGHFELERFEYEFAQKRKQITDMVHRMANISGFRSNNVFRTLKTATNGKRKTKEAYWRCHISGPDMGMLPISIPRKRDPRPSGRATKPNQRHTMWGFTVTKLDRSEEEDYYGFTVDGNNRLLLADNTVTHNTSLLDILAGRKKSGVVEGDIFVNGKVVDRNYQLMKGYVLQDNLMMETMTVRELLTFSADMRLPEMVSKEEKIQRVEQALVDLDICHLSERQVGGLLKRGISGGEKRRVAIGMELVVSPSILFVDEPSSGLDSFNALSVMRTLKRLADRGKTIIFSIHQPSSSIFALFDQLLLLGEGRCCYYGPSHLAKQHFEGLGYQFPPDHNPADVLVELAIRASRDYRQRMHEGTVMGGTTELDQLVQAALEAANAQNFDNLHACSVEESPSPYSGEEKRALLRHQKRNYASDSTNGNANLQLAIRDPTSMSTDAISPHLHLRGTGKSARRAAGTDLYLTTFYKQFWHLAWRSFKNFLRNPLLLPAHLLLSVIMGVFLGAIYWQQELDFYGSQNRLGAMFFMCAMFGFGAMTSLGLFVTERAVFIRERANGYYRPEAYFLAKILFDIIPLRVLPPILFSSCAYWMIGLRPGIEYFSIFLAFTVMFNVVSGGICFVIGVVCPNVALSNIIALAANLYFMLFGGFLINTDQMPQYLLPLKYMSPYQFTLEALMVNEFTGRVVNFNPRGFPSIRMPGNKLLQIFGYNALHMPMDAGILFLMAMASLVIAGVLLRILVKEKL